MADSIISLLREGGGGKEGNVFSFFFCFWKTDFIPQASETAFSASVLPSHNCKNKATLCCAIIYVKKLQLVSLDTFKFPFISLCQNFTKYFFFLLFEKLKLESESLFIYCKGTKSVKPQLM